VLVLRAELVARRALTHRWMDHSGRIRERGMAWSFLAEYTFVHYPTQVLGLEFSTLPSFSTPLLKHTPQAAANEAHEC
jgi:hypothetical protein